MKLEEKFIFTPIETIMEEAVSASASLGGGIETYPVSEYIFQSLFLKMTGSQEQKLRCICWYIASFDYKFRFEYLDKYKELHQFSALSDKTIVYGFIRDFIQRHDSKKVVITDAEKDSIIRETAANIARIFGTSSLKEWNQRQYQAFKLWAMGISSGEVACGPKLLIGKMKEEYEELHDNRNRYAHNTLSYQQNLPSMKSLVRDKECGNYYKWFFLLILLDKIFINRFDVAKVIIDGFE
jgi:hypothetical protein